MPRYEKWDTDGNLLQRIVTDDDGNVLESWPDEPAH